MRGFCSHLKNFSLVFVIFLFHPSCPVFAQDIEIDLGGNPTPTSKALLSKNDQKASTSPQTTPVSSITKSGSATEETSPKPSKPSSASAVNQVSVSSEGDEARVSIDGVNLPLPEVKKISNQKFLIKLTKTKLNIRSKISTKDLVVKYIRSSSHPGKTAWIVLDVTKLKKWDLAQTKSGYLITLNPSDAANKPSEETFKEESLVAGENASDNKLFFRLIDVSFKPVDKGIKIVLTSDGPSKYTARKLSQPEKLIIRF